MQCRDSVLLICGCEKFMRKFQIYDAIARISTNLDFIHTRFSLSLCHEVAIVE